MQIPAKFSHSTSGHIRSSILGLLRCLLPRMFPGLILGNGNSKNTLLIPTERSLIFTFFHDWKVDLNSDILPAVSGL